MDPKDQNTWPWKPESSLDVFIHGEVRRLISELAHQPEGWWIRVVITHGDRRELTQLSGPYKNKQVAQRAIGPVIAHIQQRLDREKADG